MKLPHQIIARFFYFYIDGFRNLSSWGKKLWLIILIKLFIMFVILKIFFFPDILNKKYDTDKERAEHVRDQLINSPNNND
jgi:Na+/H+ antiporter NhaD/arsenite permease-like protein